MEPPRKGRRSSARAVATALALLLPSCAGRDPAPVPTTAEQRAAVIAQLDADRRFRAALAATDEWLATDPASPAALDWKTRLLRELGEERAALALVLERRAGDPKDAALAYEAGELLAHDGATERALAAFDEARALAPDDWRPAVAAAALLLQAKSPDAAGAEQRLAPFLAGPHACAEARFHQALARESVKDEAGARAALEAALALDPQHVPSLRDLALLLEQAGDVAGALDCWRRVKRASALGDPNFSSEVDRRIESLKARASATEPPAPER
jgi:tetratricopeptide (TPR) repeat protein